MREPLSLRISDETNPKRGEELERVLDKRRSNPSDVIRGLVDAYIRCEGQISFPVRLSEFNPCGNDPIERVAKMLSISESDVIHAFCEAIEEQIKRYGGAFIPFEILPRGAATPEGKRRAKRMIHAAMQSAAAATHIAKSSAAALMAISVSMFAVV